MHKLIPEIAKNFKTAEEKIKVVERLGGGLHFPAVNQLRYVAFHVIRAIQSTDENVHEDELREALYHTQRAIYDGVEIGIVYTLDEIHKFQMDYRMIEVTDIVPDYLDICRKADDAKHFILSRTENSVKEHSHSEDTKPNAVQDADKILTELLSILEKLKYARQELNKKVRRTRNAAIIAVSGLALAFLGLLVAISK